MGGWVAAKMACPGRSFIYCHYVSVPCDYQAYPLFAVSFWDEG